MPKQTKKGLSDAARFQLATNEKYQTRSGGSRVLLGPPEKGQWKGMVSHAEACIRNLDREVEWLLEYQDYDLDARRIDTSPNNQRFMQAAFYIRQAIKVLHKVR